MVDFTDNDPSLLLLGDNTFVEETFIAAGALTFPKGLLLGRVTASGKYTFFNGGAADGTEVASAVLTNALTTTGAGDTVMRIMKAGKVRKADLLEWNAGTPHAPTEAEVFNLRTNSGILSLDDRELRRFDNNT